ncbi:MAG: sulfotransferase domain-containing protein [Gemmataceae bacterium]
MRLAIISTPRSGNNWLQHLLASTYDLTRLSPNTFPSVEWDTLPERCAMILHWHRVPALRQRLAQHGFRVVVLARHPLDVLISILHYCLHYVPDRWLEREAGNEQNLIGAVPTSDTFARYATSRRAAALLSISCQWWRDPHAQRVRYEDLCQDPVAELRRLMASWAETPRHDPEVAAATNTLQSLRSHHAPFQHHFWQGKPGLWRFVLPAAVARRIADAQAEAFAELGYACDPDLDLLPEQADQTWRQLTWPGLIQDQEQLRALRHETRVLRAELDAVQQQLQETTLDLRAKIELLDELGEVGPRALAVAHLIRRLSLRCGGLSRWVKQLCWPLPSDPLTVNPR